MWFAVARTTFVRFMVNSHCLSFSLSLVLFLSPCIYVSLVSDAAVVCSLFLEFFPLSSFHQLLLLCVREVSFLFTSSVPSSNKPSRRCTFFVSCSKVASLCAREICNIKRTEVLYLSIYIPKKKKKTLL